MTETIGFRSASLRARRLSLLGVITFAGHLVTACSGESGDDGAGGSAGSAPSGKGGGAGSSGSAGKGGDPGVAGDAGAAGKGGAGSGGSGGGSSGQPILDRPARLEFDCTVTTPLEKLGLNPWVNGSLATSPDGTFLLRGQGSGFNPNRLVLSGIDASGTLGAETELANVGMGSLYPPDLVEYDGGFAALWLESAVGDITNFYFAALDESGVVTQARTLVSGISAARLGPAKIATRPGGYAALYLQSDQTSTRSSVKFALLDANGALVGEPKTLSNATRYGAVGNIIALPDGFAVTYSEYATESRLQLAFLDADGNADGESIQLGEPSLYMTYDQTFLRRGNELIVAFTQQRGGFENSDIDVTVQLAKFDVVTHAPTLERIALQTSVEDRVNVDPELVAFGEDIGLAWSQGGFIYICAGCMPDNHLNFVMLDGDDFTPLSEVVTLENEQPMGGFILPKLARSGEGVIVTSSLQYHVTGEGAFAGIGCTPRN